MKGLILRNIMSASVSLKMCVITAAIASIIGVIFRIPYLSLVVSLSMLFPYVGSREYAKDFESNWHKIELTMPVNKSAIILSKYICFIIYLLIACFMVGVYTILSLATGALVWETRIVSFLLIFNGFVINMGALFYPLVLKFGISKVDILLMIVIALPLLPMRIFMNISSKRAGLENVFDINDYPLLHMPYIICSLILFIVSYFIAVNIYSKKEF